MVHRSPTFTLRELETRSSVKGRTDDADRPSVRSQILFVHDALGDGRKLRTFNVVDAFTRECLAIEVDTSCS
jgi:hypothetical protein